MNSSEIMKALSQPFAASEVEWRLQNANDTRGLAVPYIDSRAIQRRLDEVVGAFNWKTVFSEWHDKAQLCGISIYYEDRKEWITKYDGADNSDIEPIKGGLSDAFKRAAVHWGVGRYLYSMDSVWVDVEKRGKSTVIKKEEQRKLDEAHDRAVAQMATGGQTPTTKPATPPPAPKAPEKSKPAEKKAADKPNNPPIGAGDGVLPFPELYTVTSAKKSENGNGVSTALDLTDPQGKPVRAYLRGENPAIQNGVKIKDLKLIEKTSSYGPYFVLDKYEIAA